MPLLVVHLSSFKSYMELAFLLFHIIFPLGMVFLFIGF